MGGSNSVPANLPVNEICISNFAAFAYTTDFACLNGRPEICYIRQCPEITGRDILITDGEVCFDLSKCSDAVEGKVYHLMGDSNGIQEPLHYALTYSTLASKKHIEIHGTTELFDIRYVRETETPIPEEYCQEDFCYVMSRVLQPWEGNAVCLQNGGELASIHSEEEEQAVLNAIAGQTKHGVGLIGLNLTPVWQEVCHQLGFYYHCTNRLGDVNENWTDGSEVDYRNFAVGQPNNEFIECQSEACCGFWCSSNGNEHRFTEVKTGDGKWYSVSVNHPQQAVCKIPRDLPLQEMLPIA